MSIFRECLAVSMFFVSVKYLLNNKIITYYFIVIIAFLFHVSAVILFVLPLLKYGFKFNSKILLFIVLFIPFLIPFTLKFMNSFFLSLGLDSILAYSERYYHGDAMFFSFSIANYIKNIVLFILLYYSIKENVTHCNHFIYNIFFMYIIIDMIAAMQIGMFFRFANYLFVFYYYVINEFLVSKAYKIYLKNIAFLIILYQPINIHLSIFSNEYNNLLCPYASYFWGDKEHYKREQSITVSDYVLW